MSRPFCGLGQKQTKEQSETKYYISITQQVLYLAHNCTVDVQTKDLSLRLGASPVDGIATRLADEG